MIQRIQTVYLFFVFCLMAALVFIPFSPSWTISLDAGIVAVLSIITIFLYKKRSLQIISSYIMLLLLALAYILHFIDNQQPFVFSETGYTFIFPFIAAIFIYLAMRGIRNDDKLVRSLDRLR